MGAACVNAAVVCSALEVAAAVLLGSTAVQRWPL